MPISTYIRTPLTDLAGPLVNSQFTGPCSNMEMKAINCLEAYGEERAQIKCKELLEDLHECVTKSKQMLRVLEMKVERERQVKSGERGYAEGPALDSYQGQTTL